MNKKTTCTSILHAFTDSITSDTASINMARYVSRSGSSPATVASAIFMNSMYFSQQGTFNTSDNSYYLFRAISMYTAPPVLYKINSAGVATSLSAPDTGDYSSVVYNRVTNELYGIRSGVLVKINTTASAFTVTSLITPANPFSRFYSLTSVTVDNGTGDMYFATRSGTMSYVEQYHPGASSSTVVASVAGSAGMGEITELRFNSSDNMLYALRHSDTMAFQFVRINPTSGTVTTLSTLPFEVNVDAYSAIVDACANRYIISTFVSGVPSAPFNLSVLCQLDMTGTIVQRDTTSTFYQGLAIE